MSIQIIQVIGQYFPVVSFILQYKVTIRPLVGTAKTNADARLRRCLKCNRVRPLSRPVSCCI